MPGVRVARSRGHGRWDLLLEEDEVQIESGPAHQRHGSVGVVACADASPGPLASPLPPPLAGAHVGRARTLA